MWVVWWFWLVILRVMVTDKYSKRFSGKDIVRGCYFTFEVIFKVEADLY
jgi:hypothetical protein